MAATRKSFFKDRRLAFFAGMRQRVETFTLTGGPGTHISKTLRPYGNSVITSSGTSATWKIALPPPGPGSVGLEKRIVVKMAAVGVSIVNQTNATKYFGSTSNAMSFSTAYKQAGVVDLLAISSAQWAICTNPGSTAGALKSRVYTLANVTS